jgi:putative hemolysin
MNAVLLEMLIIFLLILLNGVLSMSEIAVVSARKVRLQQRARENQPGAQAALDLATSPSHFLSTVQIGITLIGILAGAFGGATIAKELAVFLNSLEISWLAAYSEAISVALVVLAVTFLTLILGELAPKQIGLTNPEGIAARIAPSMKTLSRITAPLVRLISASAHLVLRLMGIRPSTEPEVTEEEIKLLIEQGTQGGIFQPEEEEMVEQVFRLADRPIMAQMTPRTEIAWLDLDDPLDAIREALIEARYSYYPVGRGGVDNLLGLVQAKDLLASCLAGEAIDLQAKMLQPLFLPESMTILEALKRMRASHAQVALIIDEFGGIQGMSTITDILEAIAGEFPDAAYRPDPEIIARPDGSFLLDGMLDIDRFKDYFNLGTLPGEEENYYQTLGGFMMNSLGRVPSAGDAFECQNLRLEIVDMDGLRVDKVLATPIKGGA